MTQKLNEKMYSEGECSFFEIILILKLKVFLKSNFPLEGIQEQRKMCLLHTHTLLL